MALMVRPVLEGRAGACQRRLAGSRFLHAIDGGAEGDRHKKGQPP